MMLLITTKVYFISDLLWFVSSKFCFLALMETASFYGDPDTSGCHKRYSVQQEIAPHSTKL
ncbi:hypothetical protein OIU83_06095 [Flavobacterium sp. LS1R49]|uniref:Uncharacterized protein n=1 Tax=Flavobacterium shii TaxID=2987687 RepID=A0A9X2YU18_9FLAO|nr:hypothetical protein [Flavobacterium shii]MCV9927213.1 hypothetical protein [Flavobacterium shii]